MNDYWDYLAHARKSREMPGHKYFARVETGVKKGRTVYRYFYSKAEYDSYINGAKTETKLPDGVTQEEVDAILKKHGADSSDVTVTKVVKNKNGSLYIAYQKTGDDVVYSITDFDTWTDKLKRKVSATKKKVTDTIKKLLSKLPTKNAKDKGKSFVEDTLSGETEQSPEEKAYRTSEVGTRARSHTYVAKVELPNGKHRYFYSQDDYDRYLARQKYLEEEPDFMKDVPKQDVVTSDETRADSMAEINEEYAPWLEDRSQNCMYCTTAYELRQRGYDVQAAICDANYEGTVADMYSHWYENPNTKYLASDGTIKDANAFYKVRELYTKAQEEYGPAYNKAWEEYSNLYDESSWFAKQFGSKKLNAALKKAEDAKKKYDDAVQECDEKVASPEYKTVYNDLYGVGKPTYSGKQIFDFIQKASEPGSRGNFVVQWSSGGGHSMIYEVDKHGNVTIRDAQVNKVYQPNDLAGCVTSMQIIRTDNLKLKPGILKTVEAN